MKVWTKLKWKRPRRGPFPYHNQVLALDVNVKATALRNKASCILTTLTRSATVTGSHTSCTNTDNVSRTGRTIIKFGINTKSLIWQQTSAGSG